MQKMLLPALSKAETDLACNVGIDPAMGSLYRVAQKVSHYQMIKKSY